MAKKPKTKKPALTWAADPAEHDYPAAATFLSLICAPALVQTLTEQLQHAPLIHQAAKDILRAARLPLLPPNDPEVRKDLKKVAKGTPLSPVLLVCGDLQTDRPLQIADGYHRVCASYHLTENTEIPCRLVAALPTLTAAAPGGPGTG
jgi:hypothetical protein